MKEPSSTAGSLVLWRRVALFMQKFGWMGICRLLIYPITLLLTTPVRLLQSLWASRKLADGDWHGVVAFTSRIGLQSLFYLTAAENIERFGRRGRSPYVGLGAFPLSRWFHYSLPSLLAYRHLTPIVPIIGMFGWLAAQLVWTQAVSPEWVLLVLLIAAMSTSFYANLFVYQNYNALGWMFFPAGLYAVTRGQWLIAAAVWLACSFTSMTVVAIATAMSTAAAVTSASIWPVMAIAPAVLKLSGHLFLGGGRAAVVATLKSIGFKRRSTRYRYPRGGSTLPFGLSFEGLYFALIYSQFFVVAALVTRRADVFFFAALLLGVVNAHVARFADPQSIMMMTVSVATITVLQTPSWLLLASYWILVSPIPLLMQLPYRERVFDVVPRYEPFSVQPLVEEMERFFAPVARGERVLMAFQDPGSDYDRVFDGYRVLLELPLFVATRRQFHLMPDWWAVFELNFEGAPELWGRDQDAVARNAERWRADYVLVYQAADSSLGPSWVAAGFEPLTRFSWRGVHDQLRSETLYLGADPEWTLLKVPVTSALATSPIDTSQVLTAI